MATTQDIGSGARASSLLDALARDEWESLRRQMRESTFAPGNCLLSQGTIQPDFQIIIEGAARVSALNPKGERLELSRLGRGDCIGEMALLTGEPASADIHAITPVTTYAISQDDLAVLDEERSRIIAALSVILAGRLQRANERLLTMHTATVYAIDVPLAQQPLLARLPSEMARATGARVYVLAAGEDISSGFLEAIDGPDVMVHTADEATSDSLRNLLHRLEHQHQHIVLFAGRALLAEALLDASVRLSVVTEREASETNATGGAQIALISEQPWTHANVRRLSSELGREVVAVLPPRATSPRGRDPLAKLARVLTKRQVGVALGAGAAKGFAHIGVLRAFEELELPVDVVTGTSIGAAIAAGYAVGLSPADLGEAAARIAAKARRLTVPMYSFFDNGGIKDELQEIAATTKFEDLKLPLAVVATDIYRRSEVTFKSGVVWPCVLASMAIPGIYPPLRGRGSYLVDGGVLSPVPAQQARGLGAGFVIGVRLTATRTSPRDTLDVAPARPMTAETIMRAMEIMHNRISEMSNDQADLTIEICLEGGGLSDFKRGAEYMEQGYRIAMAGAEQLAAVPSARIGERA